MHDSQEALDAAMNVYLANYSSNMPDELEILLRHAYVSAFAAGADFAYAEARKILDTVARDGQGDVCTCPMSLRDIAVHSRACPCWTDG